ncbi:MAG TPA: glutamate 5-kinase [Bacteriovoracaceae bacterium]|nr:glutamate 5-kinase [Bacteriovoracaceae bacterium]
MNSRIVIKVGSLVITDATGGVSIPKVQSLVKELMEVRAKGFLPILVSSGAINSGRSFIKKPEEKKMMISYQQAAAAVGQPLLMKSYIDALAAFDAHCAQVLVTHEDFKDRNRFLNIRNTINRLLENNILPIVNENDTVSFEEITVGDNDQLAVMIAEATDAQKLILLTEADGLYNKSPSDPDAKRFDEVDFKDDFSGVKFAAKTSVGRGGMDTKLKAVRKLTPLGVDVVIGTFLIDSPIMRLLEKRGGTIFRGNPEKQTSRRKSWLSTIVKNDAWVVVDEGCARALSDQKTSLLPIGIKKVHGVFRRGDVIQVKHKDKTIAVGISEFDFKEMDLIKGKKSLDIGTLIDAAPSKVAIHKDNLLVKTDT